MKNLKIKLNDAIELLEDITSLENQIISIKSALNYPISELCRAKWKHQIRVKAAMIEGLKEQYNRLNLNLK